MKIILSLCVLFSFALPAAATTNLNPINYCGGEITVALPDGWTSEGIERTQYGVALRAASSPDLEPADAIAEGEAVLIVSAIGRKNMTEPLRVQPDADLRTILEGVVAEAPSTFKVGEIETVTVGEQAAARVLAESDDLDLLLMALELDAEAVGIMGFSSAPGEMAHWENTPLDVAESLRYDAPRFAMETDELAFPASYAADDCSIAFAHPESWTVLRDNFGHLTLSGLMGEMVGDQVQTETMTGDIWWDVADEDVCERLDLCRVEAIATAAPDVLLNALEAYYATASERDAQRLTLGERDALLIRSTGGGDGWVAYVIQDGERFVVAIYEAALPGFTEYDVEVLSAVAHSMYFGG